MILKEGRVRNAKFAISFYFFSLGCEMGCWAGILPRVKKDHDLSNTTLGAILVAAVFGAILALPVVTTVLEKYGSRVALIAGGIISPLLFPVVGIASHIAIFVIGVFLLGFGAGWADISMNAQAVLCEKVAGKSTLGMFHSLFAVGGLAGALFGGGLLDAGANPLQTTFLGAILLLVPQMIVVWWIFDREEQTFIEENLKLLEQEQLISPLHRGSKSLQNPPAQEQHQHQRQQHHTVDKERGGRADTEGWYDPSDRVSADRNRERDRQTDRDSGDGGKSVLPSTITSSSLWNTIPSEDLGDPNKKPINYTILWSISALCFISYFGQGSIGDWSAIYLADDLNASALECTFGYVGFELFVAIGTFTSDWFVNSFGRKMLLQVSGVLSAIGLFLAVIALSAEDHQTSMAVAIAGFSISGLGLSAVPPCVVSLAGSGITGMTPDTAIAYVSSIGYVGIMVGPPFLGGISQLQGLRYSFAVDAGIMLLITIITMVYRIGDKKGSSRPNSTEDTIRLLYGQAQSQP